jgi:hypothetical protein
MKRSACLISLVLAVMFSLSFSGAQSWAGEKKYRMTGEITAIDLSHNTVVIEVPLAGKMFTVGGALSSKAILKRGGQSVGLADFQVGDRATVIWEVTEQGHLILSLKAK